PRTSGIRRSAHSEQVPSEVGNTSTRAPPCPKTSRLMSRSSAGLCQRWCSTFTDSGRAEKEWERPGEAPPPGALVVPARAGLEPAEIGSRAIALAQEEIAHPPGDPHVLGTLLDADVEIDPGGREGRPLDLGEDSAPGEPQGWAQ